MNTMANRHYNHINLGLDAADGETEVSDSRVAFATEWKVEVFLLKKYVFIVSEPPVVFIFTLD